MITAAIAQGNIIQYRLVIKGGLHCREYLDQNLYANQSLIIHLTLLTDSL